MFRTIIYLISFVLVLYLVGVVQAVDVIWTDAGIGDHLWSTPMNWESGKCPTSDDWAIVNMLPGPIIANEGTVIKGANIGTNFNAGALTVDGGE